MGGMLIGRTGSRPGPGVVVPEPVLLAPTVVNLSRQLPALAFTALLLGGCSFGRPGPEATATPTQAPPAAAAPSPTPELPKLLIANTEGEGASIRSEPATGRRIAAWPDGTEVTWLGEDRRVAAATWRHVRDPDGNDGWIAAQYLTEPAPTATATPTD